MGEFFMPAQCYDDVAGIKGKDFAQALWEAHGGSGDFVPGMIAVPHLWVKDGLVVYGHTEPSRR